jgi:hypothetical protein
MKRIIGALLIPMLVAGLSTFSSCRNKSAADDQKKLELDKVETIQQQIESNVYPLPSSAEVIKMLTELEVGYIFGISNPPENTRKYLSSTSKAINLGIYGADLSYATLYNIQQEIIKFLDAIRNLANELNMSEIYDETLYEKIKGNFDNKDELVKILSGAFDRTYKYLSENEQQAQALLVVGGAWVEGMYLTTHVSEAAYQVAGISKNLLEQKKSFDLYLELTEPYMNDPSVSAFVKSLEPIKNVYAGLGTSLTNQNIIDITKAIETVRAQAIQ